MRPKASRISHRTLHSTLCLALIAVGCSGGTSGAGGSPSDGSGGSSVATGGTGAAGSGGASPPATDPSASGGSGGGTPAAPDAATGATPDATPDPGNGTTPDAGSGTTPDASPGGAPADAGSVEIDGGATPMGTDGGPQPSYAGEIPIYCGPEVGPIVQMQCPGDPTQGYTEYKDSFHVERPYTVPLNTRFSITGGIYNFWVFPNDSAHSPIAHGKSPRTEAAFGGTYDKATVSSGTGNAAGIGYFTKGMRIYAADVLIESSAKGSIVTQVHTTATGIGPVYLSGGGIPGGMVGQWFNMKIAFDAATLKSQVYINNCLKGTVSGPRGDGHFYFKYGVYHCGSAGGCRDHFKNIHLYVK